MSKFNNKISIHKILGYFVLAAIFAFIIPIIFQIFNASDVVKIGFIIFGFDMIFAVLTGLYAGNRKDAWGFLLFFPLMFFISAKAFFISPLKYVSIVYLIASLLAYGIKK